MWVFPDEFLQNPPNLLLPPCSLWHQPNSAHPLRAGGKKKKLSCSLTGRFSFSDRSRGQPPIYKLGSLTFCRSYK